MTTEFDESAGYVPGRLSVVLAVFNAEDEINDVLDNVTSQQNADVEVVVIDGASTDGTVGIIKTRSADIAYWCSEPDSGIYDAWNKSLSRVTGEWVLFLGADDRFASTLSAQTLLVGAAQSLPGTNLVVAQARLRHADGEPLAPLMATTRNGLLNAIHAC